MGFWIIRENVNLTADESDGIYAALAGSGYFSFGIDWHFSEVVPAAHCIIGIDKNLYGFTTNYAKFC